MVMISVWVSSAVTFIISVSILWYRPINEAVHSHSSESSKPETYRAAVFEHAVRKSIDENLLIFEETVTEASSRECDIIIFPEYGMLALVEKNRTFLKKIFPDLSSTDIGDNPCDSGSSSKVIQKLSCLAKVHKIVLVANYGSYLPCSSKDENCPVDRFFLYNTNFAFNSDGQLLGVYRKFHLFEEPYFNPPSKFDVTIFQTKFATFTMFTCFDIMFIEAVNVIKLHGIQNVIYPTFWIDSYPLYISIDVQASWAHSYNVNLLAANIQNPDKGAAGSGIYSASNGALKYLYTDSWKSKLIFADVPSKPEQISSAITASDNNSFTELHKHFMYKTDLKDANLTLLQNDSGNVSVTHNGLRCYLHYSYINTDSNAGSNDGFYFGSYNGSLGTVNKKHSWSVELCILFLKSDLACSTNNRLKQNIFDKISIVGDFSVVNVLPSIVLSNYVLPDISKWVIDSHKIESRDGETVNVCYVALCGRDFKSDQP